MKRVAIEELEPKGYKALYGLESYLAQSDLSKTHKELIKIRASQINGCAFCINMHTKDALEQGETKERIFLLSAWKETDLFSKEERTILQMTEEITLIHQSGLTDSTYEEAQQLFDENYISQVIMAITVINAWNRIAVSTHKPINNE